MGIALANTGLSGIVDSDFSPLTVPGLSMWLDPDFGRTVDASDNLTEWIDRTGNGNNAVQADTGTPKTPVWTASELGSRSAAVFDGSDDFMATGLAPVAATTIFIVTERPAGVTVVFGRQSVTRSYIGKNSTGKAGFGVGAENFNTAGMMAPDAMTAGYHVITLRYDGTRVDAWDHLTQIIDNHTQDGTPPLSGDYYLGANHDGVSDALNAAAGIGEVLVYSSALDTPSTWTNIVKIQNFLIAKWPGLATP